MLIRPTRAGWSQEPPSPPQDEVPGTGHEETAAFASGCFWGEAGVYQHVQDVECVVSGYDHYVRS